MKKRKIPLRVCAGCQEQKNKKDMIRVVRTPEGNVEIDKTGKKRAAVSMYVKMQRAWKRRIKNTAWNGR